MKDPIVESLAKIRSLESKEILNEFAAPPGAGAALKTGGKFLGKALPGVGLALAAQDAYSRQKAGDTTGAAIAGLTGAASSIPVVGTAASILGTGVQAFRDKMRTGSWMPDEDEIAAGVAKDGTAQPTAPTAVAQAKPAPTAPIGKDQIMAFQKANGLTPDGVMGPKTQAALNAQKTKGTAMSEAQKIAELRDRLAQFESQPQITDENWATDALKGGINKVGNFIGGVSKGIANPAATNLKNVAAGTTASTKGIKTGAAVARNPGKVAAGAAAAGAAGAAALSGGGATKPVTPPVKPPVKPPVTPPAPTQTPNAGADPADVTALNGMAAELENSQDPADIELMKRYNGIINAINNRGADDKRTQGEIAAGADLKDAGV